MRGAASRLPSLVMALVVALVLAGCGKGSGATSSNAKTPGSSNAPVMHGGTATFAERPGTKPDYIFPMLGLSHYSVANIEQFQRLMYRSLYWIGKGGHPVLNEALSLAHKPVYTDGNRKVTITLKPYRWSNGQPVTARDVTFWINLLKANKASFAGYTPGEFPDNVTHVTVTGERTLTLTLNAPYSPTWFTYNQLSQITPLPQRVWDKTSATAPVGSADITTAGAKKVFAFLTSQAKDTATYGSNPLWKVVDGPWMLTTYHNDGYAAFVPNRRYSGPDKPKLAKFVERPFTSASSELSALRSGSTIDYGYLPLQESQQKHALVSSGYRTDPWYTWGITYMVLNFHNPRVGPIFNQLYARQALQYIVDQPAYTSRALHGYGHPTTGPVPTKPSNPYVSPAEAHVPYPHSTARATALLRRHGWSVHPGGVDTCGHPGNGPGQCGAGIRAGTPLSLNLTFASGTPDVRQEMQAFASDASKVGIRIHLTKAPFNSVVSTASPCRPQQASCSWQIANWGGGWTYGVDPYPSGDQLFATNAGSNSGSYANPAIDRLIRATVHQGGRSSMVAYENRLAKQVPVLWLPQPVYQLSEVNSKLHGTTPQSPIGSLTPERWYLTK